MAAAATAAGGVGAAAAAAAANAAAATRGGQRSNFRPKRSNFSPVPRHTKAKFESPTPTKKAQRPGTPV